MDIIGGADVIELHREKELKYTNQVPKWADIVYLLFFGLFCLAALACYGIGIYKLVSSDWGYGILLLLFGVLLTVISRFVYTARQIRENFLTEAHLREDGYYTYVKHLRTSEVFEQLITFDQMKEVLVGRTTSFHSGPKGSNGYFSIGAVLIIQWADEQGRVQYIRFAHGTTKELHEWVRVILSKGVPLVVTSYNIGNMSIADIEEGYTEIAKQPCSDLEDRLLQIGHIQYTDIAHWKTEGMLKREQEQQRANDKRFFKPLFAGVLLFNFIVTLFWMPVWEVVDGAFHEESPSITITMINVVLIFFSRTYWRRNVSWIRPIQDIFLLMLAHYAGLAAATLFQPITSDWATAILFDDLTAAVFLYGLYLIRILVKWRFKGRVQ